MTACCSTYGRARNERLKTVANALGEIVHGGLEGQSRPELSLTTA